VRERGWEIDDVTAYRTVRAAPAGGEIRDAIKSGGFDAVCFTPRPRCAPGRIAGKPHARTVVACIGPQTAATASEFGLRPVVEPEIAQVPALVDALAAYAVAQRERGATPPPKKTAGPPGGRGDRPGFRRRGRGGCAGRRRCAGWSPTSGCTRRTCAAAVRKEASATGAGRVDARVVQHTLDSLGKAAYDACRPGRRADPVRHPGREGRRRSAADDPDGIVQVALRRLAAEVGDATVLMADLCLDEYSRPRALRLLRRTARWTTTRPCQRYRSIAVPRRPAGAQVVAPSGMMDGQVGAIRSALDGAASPRCDPGLLGEVRVGLLRARSGTPPSAPRSSATAPATSRTRPVSSPTRCARPRSTSPRAPTR